MLTPQAILSTPLNDSQAGLFYLGQEGILILYKGQSLVIDPYLTDYVDRTCTTEAVRWQRLYPAPIEPEDLAFVDYVLCTHPHYDHADPDTLRRIAQANAKARFIAPAPMREVMLACGIGADQLIDALADQPIDCGAFTVTPVPAAHEALHTDDEGRYCEVGYVAAFGGMKAFHAGDCCIYDGLEARVMDMDVAFLPINGRSAFKNRDDIVGNMTCEEAVELARRTRAGLLVPMHHDLYAVNGVNPALFVDLVNTQSPNQRYHIFKPGERYILCR